MYVCRRSSTSPAPNIETTIAISVWSPEQVAEVRSVAPCDRVSQPGAASGTSGRDIERVLPLDRESPTRSAGGRRSKLAPCPPLRARVRRRKRERLGLRGARSGGHRVYRPRQIGERPTPRRRRPRHWCRVETPPRRVIPAPASTPSVSIEYTIERAFRGRWRSRCARSRHPSGAPVKPPARVSGIGASRIGGRQGRVALPGDSGVERGGRRAVERDAIEVLGDALPAPRRPGRTRRRSMRPPGARSGQVLVVVVGDLRVSVPMPSRGRRGRRCPRGSAPLNATRSTFGRPRRAHDARRCPVELVSPDDTIRRHVPEDQRVPVTVLAREDQHAARASSRDENGVQRLELRRALPFHDRARAFVPSSGRRRCS